MAKFVVNDAIAFLAPIADEVNNIETSDFAAREVRQGTELFRLVEDVVRKSNDECDIQIRFIPESDNQDNEVRNLIMEVAKDPTKENCLPLVRRLVALTDHKTNAGLLFFVRARSDEERRLLIFRFPAELGVTKREHGTQIDFEVEHEVFLRRSRKYKAVFYDKSDQYWSGFAVDKQVNDNAGKIRVISDYWIRGFLKSTLKMTPQRGSNIIATAVRRTISETSDEQIRTDLITASTRARSLDGKTMTVAGFFDNLNVSESAKSEVIEKIDNPDVLGANFQFDENEFQKNCNYLVKVLDSGAVAIAPADQFAELWQTEYLAAEKTWQYTTRGNTVQEKVRNRI